MKNLEQDGKDIKALIRNAEALGDEFAASLAALKIKLIQTRAHPDMVPHEGQAAILRLSKAEQHALASSTDLFRVHNELSKLAVKMNVEEPTEEYVREVLASPAEETARV